MVGLPSRRPGELRLLSNKLEHTDIKYPDGFVRFLESEATIFAAVQLPTCEDVDSLLKNLMRSVLSSFSLRLEFLESLYGARHQANVTSGQLTLGLLSPRVGHSRKSGRSKDLSLRDM